MAESTDYTWDEQRSYNRRFRMWLWRQPATRVLLGQYGLLIVLAAVLIFAQLSPPVYIGLLVLGIINNLTMWLIVIRLRRRADRLTLEELIAQTRPTRKARGSSI